METLEIAPVRRPTTTMDKKGWLALGIVGCLIFGIVAVGITLSMTSKSDSCESPECLKLAKRINDTMDATVDPCVDFYSYSCGGYLCRQGIASNGFTKVHVALIS